MGAPNDRSRTWTHPRGKEQRHIYVGKETKAVLAINQSVNQTNLFLMGCQERSIAGDSAHLHRRTRRRQEPPSPERPGGHARPQLRQAAAELAPEGVRSCAAGDHRCAGLLASPRPIPVLPKSRRGIVRAQLLLCRSKLSPVTVGPIVLKSLNVPLCTSFTAWCRLRSDFVEMLCIMFLLPAENTRHRVFGPVRLRARTKSTPTVGQARQPPPLS